MGPLDGPTNLKFNRLRNACVHFVRFFMNFSSGKRQDQKVSRRKKTRKLHCAESDIRVFRVALVPSKETQRVHVKSIYRLKVTPWNDVAKILVKKVRNVVKGNGRLRRSIRPIVVVLSKTSGSITERNF